MRRMRTIYPLAALCGWCCLSAPTANAYFPPNIYNPYPPVIITPVPIVDPPAPVVPPVVILPPVIIMPPIIVLPPIIIVPPVLIIDPPKEIPSDPKPPETPEPSTILMGLIGCVGIAGYSWRKKKAAPEALPVG